MEEIQNNHLGCIKPCKSWDKRPFPQLVSLPDFFYQQYFPSNRTETFFKSLHLHLPFVLRHFHHHLIVLCAAVFLCKVVDYGGLRWLLLLVYFAKYYWLFAQKMPERTPLIYTVDYDGIFAAMACTHLSISIFFHLEIAGHLHIQHVLLISFQATSQ